MPAGELLRIGIAYVLNSVAIAHHRCGVSAVPKIPQSLYLIHLMLMLSPAMFAAVIFFIVLPGEKGQGMEKDQITIFQTVAATLAVVAVGTSQLIPRFIMRGETKVPLRKYTAMKVVQWAMLEGAALFIAVVFFLTHEKNMLIPLGIIIALISLMRPTVEELERYNVRETP